MLCWPAASVAVNSKVRVAPQLPSTLNVTEGEGPFMFVVMSVPSPAAGGRLIENVIGCLPPVALNGTMTVGFGVVTTSDQGVAVSGSARMWIVTMAVAELAGPISE